MFVDVDAFLPRLFELLEDAFGPVDLRRLAFQFHPAFAGRDFHAERVLERFQKFEIVRVKRLQSARALKLQRARFSHLGRHRPENTAAGRCQSTA